MKTLYLLLITFMYLIPVSAQDSEPMPMPLPEQYNFWVGTWEGTWDEDSGRVGKAINEVVLLLNDRVVNENFKIVEGRSTGFEGKSYSIFDRHTSTWRQTWVDDDGSYLEFVGSMDANNRIMERKFLNKNNEIIHQRMVFYDIRPDSFNWDWEGSKDEGETWNLIWRIAYTRIQ